MTHEPLDYELPLPLFPLPNCVLFPGVVQPLHIFEPRYQEMMAHALADQSALAMGLLKAGWEKNYYGTPDIHTILCVGRIVTHERLSDGKYNLLLHGITRGRLITQQKAAGSLFRTVTIEPVADSQPLTTAASSALCLQRKVLGELFEKTSLQHLTIAASLQSLFDSPVPTPRLIDVLSFTLVKDVATKQALLEELDILKRGELLLRELVTLAHQLDSQAPELQPCVEATSSWPPPLSTN
jgi:uncharacterized protein